MATISIVLILLASIKWSSARDTIGNNFIQNYVFNEQKPTFVIFCYLCWSENEKVFLASEISKLGNRVSTSMKKLKDNQDHNLLFLLDLDCPEAGNVMNRALSNQLFRCPYRWLILTNSTDDTKLMTLWNIPLLPDSDVVLAKREDDSFIMTELHKPAANHSMVLSPRGYYNGILMDTRPRRELFRRRMDLMRSPLTMANVIQDSNTSIYHMEDGLELQYDLFSKVSWMNAKVAFLMLNATPRFIFSYRYGYKVNGNWSGMIRDLVYENADIGTNCMTSNIARSEVVSWTDTLAPFRARFIFRQPPLSYVSNIYALPFSSSLWVGIAVCTAISAAAFVLASQWELRFGRIRNQLDGGLSDALLLTMSALSQQGCEMEPRRTPGRIIEWVVFTALMALYTAYSANIVVLLQAPSLSIRSLSQLASSKVTLAAYDVDYNHFIFKEYSKDPVRKAIRKKVEPEKGKQQFYSLNDGVERIRQGLFAFHAIEEQLYRRVEETFHSNEKCDLMDIDFLNDLHPYAPMKKNSPYLELLRVAFKRIRETGVLSAIPRRHNVPKPQCGNKATSFISVGILDLRAVFCMMAIGFGASVAILGLEILVFSW